jgi:hypothetical protein
MKREVIDCSKGSVGDTLGHRGARGHTSDDVERLATGDEGLSSLAALG